MQEPFSFSYITHFGQTSKTSKYSVSNLDIWQYSKHLPYTNSNFLHPIFLKPDGDYIDISNFDFLNYHGIHVKIRKLDLV